ncbi:hypothetical protein GCM10020001_036020 [Nonomuraea salmonea]
MRRHPGQALGQRPHADQQRRPGHVERQVGALSRAEVGERVVALVGLVLPPGEPDQRPEPGRRPVNRAVLLLQHLAQVATAALDPAPYARVHHDGHGSRGAAEIGGTQRGGEFDVAHVRTIRR